MLSIPVFTEIEGITIFRDDADPTRFYYLPRNPKLLNSEDDKPMFTFLRYQFPIERPDSEPGGGYLVFTTSMNEDPAFLESKVKPVLTQRLRSEMPATVVLPEVVLAPINFTDGEVRLIIIQNDRFVKAINLGKPSLFGDNTASVAVELSADGATLFYEALKQGGSVAAIEYNLRFPVRLPAVTIIGHVDSKEVKDVVMGYTTEKVTSEDTWGNESSHEVAHRTSIAETMESQGLVHLEILKGNVDLSEDDMESLRAFAFRSMDEFIKEHFLKGSSIETEEDRKSQWMSYLKEDISARFDLNVTYRDVISRDYNPSAQINPSFLSVPIDDVLMDIDLGNAPWYFNNLEVEVDTNFDFERYGEIVHSVVGHITYDQRRPDGSRLTKRESVVFTVDDRKSKEFKTRLADIGKDNFHVEVEVNYKSGPVLKTKVDSFNTTTRHLTLNVPNPGIIEINFAAAPKSFDGLLTAVEVEVEYGDPRNKVPRAVETIILDSEKPEVDYQRVIYALWDKPYRYRFTYILKDADGNIQRSTTEWLEASYATRYVKVPTPFDEQFNLTLLPSVDWSEIRELVVDLDYDDPENDYSMRQSFSFSRESAGIKNWKFPLRNPDKRTYRYKQTLLLQNSAVEEKPWQKMESDAQTLVVGNAPGGVVTVEVDPSDVDLGGQVKRVIVNMRYQDPANNLIDTETFLFRDSEIQVWTVARADASLNKYKYDVEYFMMDGTRRKLTEQTETISANREYLFIPPAPVE